MVVTKFIIIYEFCQKKFFKIFVDKNFLMWYMYYRFRKKIRRIKKWTQRNLKQTQLEIM